MKLPVLLAAAALAICLTGCSHAQTDATPSATSETAGAAATATPAATPATSAGVGGYHPTGQPRAAYRHDAAARYCPRHNDAGQNDAFLVAPGKFHLYTS